MLHLIVRKGICLEINRQWSIHLRSTSQIPVKKIVRKVENNNDELTNIEKVAIPVDDVPTIDVSKRLVSSSTASIIDDATKKIEEKCPDRQNEWIITPSSTDTSKLLSHYKKLSKFRLTSLVVITSMAGYAMAPAPFDLSTFLLCSAGTGLVSAAANAINQYHEVPFDAQMSRTKNRVLVMGVLTTLHAIGFAIGAATTGLSILYFGVNGLTTALAAGNLFLYTSIYTPMKRFSILNTWVGSVVGSIPPLMGWAGCAGTLDAGAWILAGLLYAWQFPHFNALSWNLRPDYSRAGYRMMAVTNPGLCRRTALRYTIGIGILSLAAPYFDVTNQWFALETLPLNAYFTYLAWKFYKESDSGSSRKLFRFSLIHLPALMILFLLNKKRWIFTEQSDIPLELDTATAAAITESNLNEIDVVDGQSNKKNSFLPSSTQKSLNASLNKVLPITIAATAPPEPSVLPASATLNLPSNTTTNTSKTEEIIVTTNNTKSS